MPSMASQLRLRFAPARTSVSWRSAAPMHVKCMGEDSASPFASLAVQIQRSRPFLAGGGAAAINADKTVAFAKYIGKFVILR